MSPCSALTFMPRSRRRRNELVAADLRAHEHDRLIGPLGLQHARRACRPSPCDADLERELLDRVDRERRGSRPSRAPGRTGSARPACGSPAASSRENSAVWRLPGVSERIFSTSSRKPRSSISSASSSTTKRQSCSTSEWREIRSSTRPTRADDDVPAGAQLRLLGADRRAAEDGDDVDALARAVRAQRLRDLDAQLARRRQHERLHLVDVRIDVLDQRQAERRRLARAGLRLADHVRAGEQRRDALLLDRAGRFVADVAQRVEEGVGEAELGEGRHAT